MSYYDDDLIWTPEEREQVLGFRPQNENPLNALLPYASELDEESKRLFDEIKTNLGKAILLRELKPGACVWTSRLIKFLKIYGHKFSKEDHVALLKLLYELVLIPDLEPCKINKYATLFSMLIKKRHLISPEDLTLPWRPLYEMGKKILAKSRSDVGMYHFLGDKDENESGEAAMLQLIKKFLSGSVLESNLSFFGIGGDQSSFETMSLETSYYIMVKYARQYFPLTATKEIMDEFLPRISMWGNDNEIIFQFVSFLPVSISPSHAAFGHELWFDKMMDFWTSCCNSHSGGSDIISLFTDLAKYNPGAVDWTPYVADMFTRFMHAFNLPVGFKDMQYPRSINLDVKHIASWIVWTIAPDGLVMKHLSSFLTGTSTYLHSANSGRWSYKLRDFLRKLTREFLNRVRREKRKETTWENRIPDSHKLREEDITKFVEIVFESALIAISSRAEMNLALHDLAVLRPAIVCPPLVEKLHASLESVTEPHRLTAILSIASSVARPLLSGPSAGYPEGPTHIVSLLLASLPGIDPNDVKKTLCTLQFILIYSWMVPYIDCSSAYEYWPDLTEEERLTCESTAQFEDFIMLYLERIFNMIESFTQESVRHDTKETDGARSKLENVVETALFAATSAVMMQCSPQIFKQALRKFKNFALQTNFEPNVAGSIVGVILRVFTRVDSDATLAAFVPELCDELGELMASDEALKEENPPRELLYRLQLLSYVVEANGVILLKYIPRLLPILDRGFKQHAKQSISRTCDILAHIMTSLSIVEITESKSINKDYSTAPKDWLPIREWGKGCLLKNATFSWHIPNDDEVACAQMLMDRYMKPEIARLELWLRDERPMSLERRLRSLMIIQSNLSCFHFLPQPVETPVHLVDTLIPATSFPLVSSVRGQLTLDGGNVRAIITQLLRRVQTKLLQHQSDDTRCFELLIQLWERVSGIRSSRCNQSVEARKRTNYTLERNLDCRGGFTNTGRIRTLLSDSVRLQDEGRFELQSDAGITENGLTILTALFELSINTYASVRVLAQCRLFWIMSNHAYSYKAIVPLLRDVLTQGGEGDEWHAKHKGSLFVMMGPKTSPLIVKQDWEVIRALWPMILEAQLSEKQSILRLEHVIGEAISRNFPTVNTILTITEDCIQSAKVLMPKDAFSNPDFQHQLKGAIDYEKSLSAKNERLYKELLDNLVQIAESPTVIWRRLELTLMMLTHCPSLQVDYSPNVVRLVLKSQIHDDVLVRKLSWRLTHFVLKQRKLKVKKIKMSPYDIAGVPKPEVQVPGYRPDLEWAIWSEDRIPKTDEDWEKPFLRNAIGFYAWPEEIEVAAPSYEQPFVNRSPEDMEEGERYIYEKFTDDEYVDKFVKFMTSEEKKGKEKFSGVRFVMFRCLFRSFGYPVAAKLLKHALEHAGKSQEPSQRFACEVAAAAVRAPRYWDRATAMAIYNDVIEIFKIGLGAVTPETTEEWGTAVASALDNVDVHRVAPVIKALVEIATPPPANSNDADSDQHSSFGVCARLYGLQGVFSGLSWQVVPIVKQLLHSLEAAKYIQHPYQNVRESVGSMLVTIFDTTVALGGGSLWVAPVFSEFLERVKPNLAPLYDEHGEVVIKSCAGVASAPCEGGQRSAMSTSPEPELRGEGALVAVAGMTHLAPTQPVSDESQPVSDESQPQQETSDDGEDKAMAMLSRPEKMLVEQLEAGMRLSGDVPSSGPKDRARAVNLFTTILRACMGISVRGVNGFFETQYELLKTACALSARGPPAMHDEIARAADGFLAVLSTALHKQGVFDIALTNLEGVATSKSWWARYACVEFAQPLLFYGLPLICQAPERAVRAEQFALKLMMDSRLEVRRAASKLLTGLMHCHALPDEDKTIDNLMKKSRSKKLIERHCGVLGLCAYLASRPYSLGPRIGIVLAELSRHTNAPDPVPSAIRVTLADFRRTHQDDWPRHRASLTEEELDLLADLTSPPSYCA